MYRKKNNKWVKHIDFILLDYICMVVTFLIIYIKKCSFYSVMDMNSSYRNMIILLSLLHFLVSIVNETYSDIMKKGYYKVFAMMFGHISIIMVALSLYFLLTKTGQNISREVFAVNWVASIISTYVVNELWKHCVAEKQHNKQRGKSKRTMLIITEELNDKIIESIINNTDKSIEIVGICQIDRTIFFSQTRIGENGRKFKIYKFRSMYKDAEKGKQELMSNNEMGDDFMFKIKNDPRIIGGEKGKGIGNFIRNTSIDEFPQFFNVLKGDMSLVGTRPPTVDEWEKYELHHRRRMSIRPGLTGMWQVSGRSDITDFETVVSLDTDYIENWSIGLDLRILAKTFLVVIKKQGSK